ncbi:protein phloem protein 2-like a1 [Fagus crenata]
MHQTREVEPDGLVGEIQEQSSDETDSINGMEIESQQVEQSSDETKSVNGMEQVEETSETDPVKGKELTTKRGTTPPLNFLAILNDANITDLDMSSPDKLCDQLYAGVFLEPNKLKYFVDKKLNKNCFVVFARKLLISWYDNPEYWKWTKEKDTRGEDIEVAELVKVLWLDIQGTFQTIDLSPGTVYEVVFIVKIEDYSWRDNSVTLTLILPRSKSITRHVKLNKKPLGKWIEIQVGEFIMSPENVGEITFKLGEYSSEWKTRLVLKCAIIRPKNY